MEVLIMVMKEFIPSTPLIFQVKEFLSLPMNVINITDLIGTTVAITKFIVIFCIPP